MRIISFLLFLAISTTSHATTWLVGPSRSYTRPSQVSTLVHDGDTVAIDAGLYDTDVARWSANNLVLKGVGGRAHLRANGTSYGGKGIWVIAGRNTLVESIEFSLCACQDNNGAGIRQEGIDLTVRQCYFHDNQNGILAGDNPTSAIVIERCEFSHNGYGDGFTHNLYINHVASLTFQFNYSHDAVVGHELKSRAYQNYILYNRIANEATGTASRNIDMPNGGLAVLIGNEIQQGANTSNSNMVGFGLEGLSNPSPHRLVMANNTLVNERGSGSFVSVQSGTDLYKAYNNIFAGTGTRFLGSPTSLDTAANIYISINGAGFINASLYDYHLTATSPAINAARDAGAEGILLLLPISEYHHPTDGTTRPLASPLDIGAYEHSPASSVSVIAMPIPSNTKSNRHLAPTLD